MLTKVRHMYSDIIINFRLQQILRKHLKMRHRLYVHTEGQALIQQDLEKQDTTKEEEPVAIEAEVLGILTLKIRQESHHKTRQGTTKEDQLVATEAEVPGILAVKQKQENHCKTRQGPTKEKEPVAIEAEVPGILPLKQIQKNYHV